MTAETVQVDLLKKHIELGESQYVEFKEDIPNNTKELANNAASFASCNQGIIYLGIGKNSDILGLSNVLTSNEKDEFQLRLSGILDNIEPKIKYRIEFIEIEQKVIVKITIPKGDEPIYFVNNIPYIRILSKSRPAKPDEVKGAYQHFFLDKQNNFIYLEQQNSFKELLYHFADVHLLASTVEEQFPRKDLIQNLFALFEDSISKIRFNKSVKSFLPSEMMSEIIHTLQELANFKFYLGQSYTISFVEKSKKLIKLIDPLIPQIRKNLSEKELESEYKETLNNAIEKLKIDWEWSKKYRIQLEHLERTKMNFRECAFTLHRLALLPNSFIYGISNTLQDISRQIMLFTTPQGFGHEALGFDNIEHLRPKVELVIDKLENLSKDKELDI